MNNQSFCEDLLKAHAYFRRSFLSTNKDKGALDITHPGRNVVAVGIGPKLQKGQKAPGAPEAIRFYVERKVRPLSRIPSEHRLPENITGLPTDVIETGRFRRSAATESGPLRSTTRPIQPGLSCGVKFGNAGESVTGTIGAIVARDGRQFFLSSAHVLGRSNSFFIGSPVLVPGPADLPVLQDEKMRAQMQMDMEAQIRNRTLALIASHYKSDVMSSAVNAATPAKSTQSGMSGMSGPTDTDFRLASLAQCIPISLAQMNKMDAAMAEIPDKTKIDYTVSGSGPITDSKPIEPRIDMPVQKMGRATKLTKGTILQPDICAQVDFTEGIASFSNQILIEGDSTGAFAWEGDSGALVFTEFQWGGKLVRLAVGLLFAFSLPSQDPTNNQGGKSFALATPLSTVLSEFGAELVTG